MNFNFSLTLKHHIFSYPLKLPLRHKLASENRTGDVCDFCLSILSSIHPSTHAGVRVERLPSGHGEPCGQAQAGQRSEKNGRTVEGERGRRSGGEVSCVCVRPGLLRLISSPAATRLSSCASPTELASTPRLDHSTM